MVVELTITGIPQHVTVFIPEVVVVVVGAPNRLVGVVVVLIGILQPVLVSIQEVVVHLHPVDVEAIWNGIMLPVYVDP